MMNDEFDWEKLKRDKIWDDIIEERKYLEEQRELELQQENEECEDEI